jgi:hypothetical protein
MLKFVGSFYSKSNSKVFSHLTKFQKEYFQQTGSVCRFSDHKTSLNDCLDSAFEKIKFADVKDPEYELNTMWYVGLVLYFIQNFQLNSSNFETKHIYNSLKLCENYLIHQYRSGFLFVNSRQRRNIVIKKEIELLKLFLQEDCEISV